MIDSKQLVINKNAKIRDALVRINDFSAGQALVLFVLNGGNEIVGSITDGDIRRGLLKGFSIDDVVELVMNKDYHFLTKKSSLQEIKELRDEDLKIIPLIDGNKKIIKFLNFRETKTILPMDAVIMAGGKGTRLHTYTKDKPKPLLEVGKKPLIVHNIDRLASYGVRNFYVSVNHMKEQIMDFLDNYYKDSDVNIQYIQEKRPLGTISSVSLVEEYPNDDILVMNSDILTNIDFEDFYMTYKNHSDDMSIATFNIKIDIPYAVLQTDDKKINSFIEKPTYVYHSNAGIYMLKKEHLALIPKNEKYDAIDLMTLLIESGKKVTHFPIRGYWIDIGNDQNYKKAQDDIKYVKF